MATKSRAKLASSKAVSTKWLQNAMRSIGISTKNVLKSDFAPNIYEAVESGANVTKSVISTLRRNAGSASQLNQQLQNNKYVKFAQDAYKNALSDLKSGNFQNEDRLTESMMGDFGFGSDDLDSLFDDSGFSFDDDGVESDVNVNIVNASNNNDAMFAMTSHLQKQTETTLKTSQANMNAMIAMNSAALVQSQQIGSVITAGLDAINKNLSSIIEYNNTNMNKFIESSMAFYERMGTKFDNEEYESSSTKKITAGQVINSSSGGINFNAYKQYAAQQLKDALGNTSAGMVSSLLDDDLLKMASSNPLGFATEGLVRFMIPKLLGNTIKGVEATFSSFMPSLLHKMADWGDGYASGFLGQAKKFIGKSLGLRIERKEEINKAANIEKGPVPFDGVTKHAITEIITKELREQTSYLKAIAEHYNIDTKEAKRNSEVFDYKTGKYITVSESTDNILNEIKNAVVNSMNTGSFGKTLRGYSSGLTTEDDQKKFNSMLDEFMLRLEKHGKFITLNDETFNDKNSDYRQLISSVNGDESIRKYIDKAVRNIVKTNPDATMDLSRSMLSARQARNAKITDIENNPTDYHLWASLGLDEGSLDDLIFNSFQQQPSGSTAATIATKKAKGSIQGKRISDKKLDAMIANANPDSANGTGSKGSVNTEPKTLKEFLERSTQGFSQMAMGFLHGSSDEAFDSFINMIADQGKLLWNKFNNTFLTPMKKAIFGRKDEDNFSRDGIFSGVVNSFKDASGMIQHYITGKAFKDSKGVEHKESEGSSVIDNFKKIGTNIKNGVIERLFGKKAVDKDGNITEERDGGLLKGFSRTIKEGLIGWQEALFGKKLDEKERENLKESMTKNLSERMPNTLTGSAIGAGVGMLSGGSLLGFLVGGPIGGAALGTAVGFASKSERFQDMLFGQKDEKGERTGGIVSKKIQDYVKKNKNQLVGGAAIGTVSGAITGGGILGTLVGGPVAGALLGLSGSILKNSHTFKEFLFGDEKTGQQGLFSMFSNLGNKIKSANGGDEGGKALGMSVLGTGAGALTGAMVAKMGILGASLSPFGAVGGALVGLGLSIRAQKDNFHKWLFGEKDKDGNVIKHGILGQFGNMLKGSVLNPLATGLKHIGQDIALELKYSILDGIRFAFMPLTNAIAKASDNVKEKILKGFTDIKKIFINPIIGKIDEYLISPLRSVITGVGKMIWGTAKKVVTFPFNLLKSVASFITNPIVEAVDRFKTTIDVHIIKPLKEKSKELFKKIFGGIFNIIGKSVKGIFGTIGGITNYLGDKLIGVGKADKEQKNVGGIITNQHDQMKQRRKEEAIARANLRKNQREDNIRNANVMAIMRATNYQLTEDTEENRKIAIANGAKINTRIKAAESKSFKAKGEAGTAGMSEDDIIRTNLKNLSDEGKQTNLLLRIYNFITGKDRKKKKYKAKSNKDNENQNQNTENTEETPETGDTAVDAKLSESEKVQRDIEEAGGLRKYLLGKAKSTKLFSLFGSFKGKGHAEGTEDTGDEAAVVGENGPELVSFSKGNKVFANSKPLAVYVTGMGNRLFRKLAGILDVFDDEEDREDAEDKAKEEANDKVKGNIDKARDVGYTADEIKERNEKEEEKAKIDDISKSVEKQAENQEEFGDSWSSIFGKKGLITGALLLAVPLLIKAIPAIKNTLASIGSFVENILGHLGWTETNAARTNGNTITEEAVKTATDITNGNFITDENGNTIARTGSATKFIARRGLNFMNRNTEFITDGKWGKTEKAIYRGAEKTVKGVKNLASSTATFAKTASTYVTGGAKYSVDDVAKAFGTSVDDVKNTFKIGKNGKISTKSISKSMGASFDDVSDLMKPVKNTAESLVKNNADDAAKSGLFKTVIGYIDDFFKKLAEKLGAKSTKIFAKISSSRIGTALKSVWSKTVGKITAKLSAGTAGAITTAGLSEILFTALGALDGATGAAKLFQVPKDKVDGTMRTVATIFGGLSGFTYTGVVMLIFDIVGPIIGVNILSSLAVAAYNFLVGANSEKANNLEKAQIEHQNRYLEERDKTLEDQYNDQLKSGIIGSDVTFDMFKAGVIDGTYSATYTSFEDWNAQVNASAGDKIMSGAAKVIKGAGKAIKNFFADDKTEVYYNADGSYYTADGVQYSATGEKTGEKITAAEVSAMEKTGVLSKGAGTIKSGIKSLGSNIAKGAVSLGQGISKGWNVFITGAKELPGKFENKVKETWSNVTNGIHNFFIPDTEDVFTDPSDGSYYTADGKHYSAAGDELVGTDIDLTTLSAMISSGTLVQTTHNTREAGIIQLKNNFIDGCKNFVTSIGNGFKKAGSFLYNTASNVADKIESGIDAVGSALGKANTAVINFFTSDTKTGYYLSDGSYYDASGKHYTAAGEELGDTLTKKEMAQMIISGQLVSGDVVTRKSGLKVMIGKAGEALSEGWENFSTGFTNLVASVKDGAISFGRNVKTFASDKYNRIKGFFTGSKKAWYDAEGGYYVSNGSTFDYYNANGDMISSGISADSFAAISNTLTEGDIKTNVTLKSIISNLAEFKDNAWNSIKEAGSATWESIKEAGVSAWNSIKENGLFGSISKGLSRKTSVAWFDYNGGYYKLNGSTYDYYNANNDLIESGIEASVVDEKKTAGLLTQGTIKEDSAAKKAITKIQESVSEAWKKAKDTVSSGWSNFTSWLTGKGGINESMYTGAAGGPSVSAGSMKNINKQKRVPLNIGGPTSTVTVADLLSEYNITSNFGKRNLNGQFEGHTGVDLQKELDSPVYSFTDGEVVTVTNKFAPNTGTLNMDGNSLDSYGNYIVIKDANGNMNYYAHLNGTNVSVGETIKAGEQIGILGHTGRSTGHHLHYEVRQGSSKERINPIEYLDSNASATITASSKPSTTTATTAKSTNTSTSTSTSATSTSSSSGSNGSSISDLFTNLASVFSEIGSRALSGALTGNFNSDYSGFLAGLNLSSSGSSTSNTSTTTNTNTSSHSGTSGSFASNVTNDGSLKLGYGKSTEENAKRIYQVMKAYGLPDSNIAGLLGNWTMESGVDPTSVEGVYDEPFTLGDKKTYAMSNPESYTKKLFEKYAAQGMKIKQDAYKGDDGVYYPGIGLGGFTGPAVTRLMAIAKSLGLNWYDLDAQLKYITVPTKEGGYRGEWLSDWKNDEASSPEEAARKFLHEWEGIPNADNQVRLDKRKAYAREYYNSKFPQWSTGGVGGPKTSFNSRIIKQSALKHVGGPSVAIDSKSIESSYSKDYTLASNATKYIDSISNTSMTKAINIIIGLLEAITGNTAGANDKLKLLENIKSTNVITGGNTNNFVTNNGGSANGSNSNKVINSGSTPKVSRNQKMAEKIAAGI